MGFRRIFVETPVDPIRFWRGRAADEGWFSVMWKNSTYNEMASRDQWNAIERNLPERGRSVLDLGCGTGRFSGKLASLFDRYVGVDLDTMVEEARRRNPLVDVEYVASSVQDYDFPASSFDLVLSMACLASACTAEELPEIARRIVASLRRGGRIIMIDPFHTWPLLVRTCRLSARNVIHIFEQLGTTLNEWSGVHFIPARLLLAREGFESHPLTTKTGYRIGEALLQLSARRFCDYCIISLTKN